MDDPQQPNHWDLLVSQLGATPAPPEPKKPKDPPQQVEEAAERVPKGPGSAPKGAKARPTPPRRPPTDWGQLANQLGVERHQQPGGAQPSDAELVALDEPAEAPPEAMPSPRRAARPIAEAAQPEKATDVGPIDTAIGDAGPDSQAAEEVAESTRTDLVPAGTEVELPGILAEMTHSAQEREAKTPERKQRRRRQKPKPARGPEPIGAAVGQPAPESEEEATEGIASSTEEPLSQDRPKRRRRRGPGRKKGGAGRDGGPADSPTPLEPVAAGEVTGGETAEPTPHKANATSDSRKETKSEKGPRSAKAAHRGIPSWTDAVGIVISTNVESRAKRPSAPSSSRPRGGRGRGGRDRSGDQGK